MEPNLAVLAPRVLLAVAPFAALVVVLVRRTARARRASLARFARRVDLPVPGGAAAEAVEHLLAVRNRSADLGAIGGVVVVAGWAHLAGATDLVGGSAWPLVVFGGAFVGAAVGAGVTAARDAARPTTRPGPRVARPTTPALEDYLAPLELLGGRFLAFVPAVMVLGASVAGVLTATVDPRGVLAVGPSAAVIAALAALAGAEVSGRRLVEQPQAAATTLELAWNDAVRARVLRDVITVPIGVGLYATFGVALTIIGAVTHPALQNAATGMLVVFALLAMVVAVVSTATAPQRHFRARLWPSAPSPSGDASFVGAEPR